MPVIKKNGTLRICIDFRELNNATPKDEYSMLVAEMLVDSAAGFECLGLLDGYSGYNQILIAEEEVPKTSFRCPGTLGTYEWVVMPFGLKNAGATYPRAMNAIFHEFIKKFMQVYIYDIVIKSSSQGGHLDHLRRSFDRMRKYGLKMNPLKCAFGVHAGNFLGFVFKYKISEKCSNNEVEYEALIIGLRLLKGLGASRIEVKGDSELVVKHVLRNENQEANELAQINSEYKMSKSKFQDMIEVREKMVSNTPPTKDILYRNDCRTKGLDEECQEACRVEKSWEHGVFTVKSSSSIEWRKPIVEYLENPVGGTDRKTKYRALSYVLSGNELLKKTPEGVLIKCLGDTEAYLAIYECEKPFKSYQESFHIYHCYGFLLDTRLWTEEIFRFVWISISMFNSNKLHQ
ncbi:uncharacterized protein LOC127129933 [Lathyrus oleraceus]|uniref:uncharacterized protein LOC127129933 n=1 Tax=Pisum sativum TaxID=3888 RepID=UPI0021D1AEEF|nr:uncharacterized protein LOC127129933 [Pisum sativum]